MATKFALVVMLILSVTVLEAQTPMNLLVNPNFDFHCFDNSRTATATSWKAGYVACWDADAYNDLTVISAPHADGLKLQTFARNVVTLKPGKKMNQVIFLPEVGLRHGDVVSLSAYGQQKAPESLQAAVHVLKIDSQTGKWKPSDFGQADQREFPKHSRGELVKAASYKTTSGAAAGDFQIKVENCSIPGSFVHKNESGDDQINSIALMVEFTNLSKDADVTLYAPSLAKGATAPPPGLQEMRQPPTAYRMIPRTIRKLWRGEPIHILLMGSSIDRGSANPPMYAYDENPESPAFKQPLAGDLFNGDVVGRPDLTGTVGQWRHYFAWGGRLRTELLRKFNYTPDKILLNYMACDGSCVSEATSGLEAYASLSLPPSPEVNGQAAGKTWQEMYPALFARPQGPAPDLVLFGSGANEKTDQPDEGAIFEATIRWFQHNYPDTEFIFCQWQNLRGYTPNTGHLMELALNYQIPFMDMGNRIDQLMNYANRYAICPSDGHPQAASHYVWFKSLEEAFEVADPIAPGIAQKTLPRRLYPTSYGWEGEIVTYTAPNPRIVGNMMVLDDTTVNCWGSTADAKTVAFVDGEKKRDCRTGANRDLRNSLFAYGKLSLGDRHILEICGAEPKLTAADCKIAPNRQFLAMDNPRWALGAKKVEPFQSAWGAPFGDKQVVLQPGEAVTIQAVGTDVAVAYVDAANAGTLKVTVDDQERLSVPANVAFKDQSGKEQFLENRKGIRELGYGAHTVRVEAVDGPVALLGVYTYDTRSNLAQQRVLTGQAMPGEVVALTPPLEAPPVVTCTGGLEAGEVTNRQVKFSGKGGGSYQIVGE